MPFISCSCFNTKHSNCKKKQPLLSRTLYLSFIRINLLTSSSSNNSLNLASRFHLSSNRSNSCSQGLHRLRSFLQQAVNTSLLNISIIIFNNSNSNQSLRSFSAEDSHQSRQVHNNNNSSLSSSIAIMEA